MDEMSDTTKGTYNSIIFYHYSAEHTGRLNVAPQR
jgi:hypothetical protein